MGEVDSSFRSDLPHQQRQSNPWWIALAILVSLLCLCVGLIGLLLAFGLPFLE